MVNVEDTCHPAHALPGSEYAKRCYERREGREASEEKGGMGWDGKKLHHAWLYPINIVVGWKAVINDCVTDSVLQ